MTEERQDLHTLLNDMRVDVAQIKTRVEIQTGALARLETKFDLGIFREEYERRHQDLQMQVVKAIEETNAVRDESLKREGAGRAWRTVFTLALATLGLVEAILHRQ